MDITSIDNMYEEDGIVLLRNFLTMLNDEQKTSPFDPLRRQIVAILPEYFDDGRLNRLDILTCPVEDPGLLTDDEIALMDAAFAIVAKRKEEYKKAIEKLEAPILIEEKTKNE